MASVAALKVADIVDDLIDISSKTNSEVGLTLALQGNGRSDFQIITLGKSEQFGTLNEVIAFVAEATLAIGSETDVVAANALLQRARKIRRLNKEIDALNARIAAL